MGENSIDSLSTSQFSTGLSRLYTSTTCLTNVQLDPQILHESPFPKGLFSGAMLVSGRVSLDSSSRTPVRIPRVDRVVNEVLYYFGDHGGKSNHRGQGFV